MRDKRTERSIVLDKLMETCIIKALIIYGLANCDSDANVNDKKSSRAEHRQHKDNKQASNKQHLDRLVDG